MTENTAAYDVGPEAQPARPETQATLPALRDLLGLRVRVWDGQAASVRAEGEVIGVITEPTLVIRRDDGTIAHEASGLPIDWRHEEWRHG